MLEKTPSSKCVNTLTEIRVGPGGVIVIAVVVVGIDAVGSVNGSFFVGLVDDAF